ncbi:MAG: TolC family protein [Verrucomicrobia bacterium]|nr:MAG: TolC family protein [Verrucomicrobiota bacterium]
MKSGIVVSVILLLAVLSPAQAGTNSVLVTPVFLNQLAEEMRTNHPALTAARARTNAAAASVAAVRTWDDPMVRVGGMFSETRMRADDGDIIYGAEQKLPLFGKPALARRVAQADFVVETANAEYQFQILRGDLAKAVFRAALAEETVAVGEQDLRWLQTISESVEGRYRAGESTLVDVLKSQNERTARATQLRTDGENLSHARLAINRLLNRKLQSGWPSLKLPEVAAQVRYSEKLVAFATRYEPKLRMMREQVKQAQAIVDSTRRARLPDVSLGVESRNYSGNAEWRQAEVMLSFNLPLFNAGKYRSEIRRDEAKRKAAEADAADYELSLREEVHNLTVKIDAARREALAYHDEIIPRSESALESARAGWEAGRAMFRDVLDARRMLLDARLAYARAVSEQYQMLSDLVLCCGIGDLEALQMLEQEAETQDGVKNP